jgi:hypothetical protein
MHGDNERERKENSLLLLPLAHLLWAETKQKTQREEERRTGERQRKN